MLIKLCYIYNVLFYYLNLYINYIIYKFIYYYSFNLKLHISNLIIIITNVIGSNK